jgi:hypothetical protein
VLKIASDWDGGYDSGWFRQWVRNPKQPFELQTTWEKRPRETVKKMEWNRIRPLGLILDEEEEIRKWRTEIVGKTVEWFRQWVRKHVIERVGKMIEWLRYCVSERVDVWECSYEPMLACDQHSTKPDRYVVLWSSGLLQRVVSQESVYWWRFYK